MCYNETMSENILEKIKNNRPRENAGSNTYNRFQFQIAFAAELIVRLCRQEKEALTFMDYLDDVVVVDRGSDSNAIIFYQVKSKDVGYITLNIILNNQWFEKMAYNDDAFKEDNRKFVLVTNTGINFNGKYIRDTSMVSLTQYLNQSTDVTIKEKILESMSNNLKVGKEDVDLTNYYLLRTDLTLDDYERQLKGELQEYANEINPKLDSQSLDVIYTKLYNELQARQSNVYNPTVIDLDELISRKSYSTEDFKRLVKTTYQVQIPTAGDMYNFLKDNNLIRTEDFINIFEFRKKYDRFSIESIGSGKTICSLCFNQLINNVLKIENIKEETLLDKLIEILDTYDKVYTTEFYSNNKFFICATFLYKYYEGVI